MDGRQPLLQYLTQMNTPKYPTVIIIYKKGTGRTRSTVRRDGLDDARAFARQWADPQYTHITKVLLRESPRGKLIEQFK